MNMNDRHYSLRWNNHQSHILASFDALLQAEMLVDVTLVCSGVSVRAHKVVLSACSPFFQRIFSETPCKHPVIVLNGFKGWEVQSIVDFMYKGEISVVHEQLPNFIKAAESLQVRGLVPQEQFVINKEAVPLAAATANNQTPTPSASPDYERNFVPNTRFPTPVVTVRAAERSPPFSPLSGLNFEPNLKLPHMPRLSFAENMQSRQDCQSPNPRRKQARPRRRSGEICGAQDLTTTAQQQQQPAKASSAAPAALSPAEETAENLCMKKSRRDDGRDEEAGGSPTPSGSPEMDLSMQGGGGPTAPGHNGAGKEFSRCSPPVGLLPSLGMKQELDSHSPLPFPPMPSVSALAMTPPHNKFFGLDAHLGLFPPGLEGCRNPLFDIGDPRTTPDPQLYVKKKMGRPKGQHSAPRGGPPRSWTNAELTEALQHVWNKKMTTSQASRIFGIPYNSLLMYVRGKYGKSLKLEQLRKDCIGGPTPPLDLMAMSGPNNPATPNNNNNTPCKPDREPEPVQPHTRPPSAEEQAQSQQQQQQQPPLFHPFTHGFYPDFGTAFPIPINMLHLLPGSDKSREYGQPPPIDANCIKKERIKELEEEAQDLFRPHPSDDHQQQDAVQQNGQE